MTIWKNEIKQYEIRLRNIEHWVTNLSKNTEKILNIPLDYSPSPQGLVALQSILYMYSGCIPFVHQSVLSFINLWDKGLFGTISLPVRLIYELWGASNYCFTVFSKGVESGDWSIASKKSKKLMLGARSEVRLPWGGNTQEQSVHINDFLRGLKKTYPDSEKTYDFLCESCHPSFLRLTTWTMAGPLINNWSNDKFRLHAHEIFNKTLFALELALNGIVKNAIDLFDLALPYIVDAVELGAMKSRLASALNISRQSIHNYLEIKKYFGIEGLIHSYSPSESKSLRKQRQESRGKRTAGNKARQVEEIRRKARGKNEQIQLPLQFSCGEEAQKVEESEQPFSEHKRMSL